MWLGKGKWGGAMESCAKETAKQRSGISVQAYAFQNCEFWSVLSTILMGEGA